MSNQLNIILNGKNIKGNPGETILQLAKRNGIEIPTLCNDPRLKPFSSCFVLLLRREERAAAHVVRCRATMEVVSFLFLLALASCSASPARCALSLLSRVSIASSLVALRHLCSLRVLSMASRRFFPSRCGSTCPHQRHCRAMTESLPVHDLFAAFFLLASVSFRSSSVIAPVLCMGFSMAEPHKVLVVAAPIALALRLSAPQVTAHHPQVEPTLLHHRRATDGLCCRCHRLPAIPSIR